uniref:Uncharacterized protein n=1 Tax=Rhizophora mucronata TaxID=61149 RepID=A0A2P2NIJ5_RHIMU
MQRKFIEAHLSTQVLLKIIGNRLKKSSQRYNIHQYGGLCAIRERDFCQSY